MSHCQFTRRDIATKDLYDRINEKETKCIPLQLTPYLMWHENGNKPKISTKLLAVECSKQDVIVLKQRMFTKLLNVPAELKYSNTRSFKFIPFSATGAINDDVIRSGIFLQNKFLTQCVTVTVININSIDWTVPETTMTFRMMAMEAVTGEGEEEVRIFSTLEMGMADNKVHMMTTKELHSTAMEWMDNLTKQLREMNNSVEYWISEMGYEGPPERINRPDSSDAHQAYANFLDQSFSPMLGTDQEVDAPKNPPIRSTYSRVVYGNLLGDSSPTDVSTQVTPSTQASSTSSITSAYTNNDSVVIQKAVNKAISTLQKKMKKIINMFSPTY